MPSDCKDLEARERDTLSPYAQLSAETRGRNAHEPPPEWRTQYQRDRDRIIHSRAFRRLDCKTQVFLSGSGDHLRTRLTHTMEVAGVARNIARALQLNEDLTEAIALGHDLGHPPFGHTGEEALNELMQGHGGFEHNQQSRRIVELIEQKYPAFPGLNLTWETLEGLSKHDTAPEPLLRQASSTFHQPSLEAQVANLADELGNVLSAYGAAFEIVVDPCSRMNRAISERRSSVERSSSAFAEAMMKTEWNSWPARIAASAWPRSSASR